MSERLWIDAVLKDRVTQPLNRISERMEKLISLMEKRANVAQKAQEKELTGLQRLSAQLEKQQKLYRGLQRAMLATALSILFTGFAIRRLTDKAFRGMFQTMQQAVGDTHRFSVATNQLRANWEFLKFTLMDALMQSGLFDWVVGKLVSLIQWVAGLDDKWKVLIVKVMAALAVIGTVFIFVGQGILLLAGNITAIIKVFGFLGKVVGGLWKLGVLAFKGIGAAIAAVSWPVIALIAAVVAIVGGLYFLLKHWKLVTNFLKILWNHVVIFMQGAFQGMVNWVISGINNILKAYNWVARKIGRDELGLLGEYTGMESRMDARGDTLWRLDAERTAMQAERTGGTTINNYDIDNNIEAQSADMGVTEMDRAMSDYFDRTVGSTY